jgi:hypothetical protein
VVVAVAPASQAAAQTATTITSAGPLTQVAVSNDLACQVAHQADSSFEFFPSGSSPGNCGTFLAIGGTVYAPSRIVGSVSGTAFTPVSQSAVTGSGTSSDPFKIVTEVTAGNTGVHLVETDSYVVGNEQYRTDITVTGSGGGGTFVLYRAADCFLQNSDTGFGAVNLAGSTVACRGVNPDGTPGGRIEGWSAITGGASYLEAGFSQVWQAIGTQQPFNNTCRCDELIDNGAGISWSGPVPASGSQTFSSSTLISPTAAAEEPGPPTPPVAGKSVVADVVSGTVFIKLPATHASVFGSLGYASGFASARAAQSAGFVPLKGASNIPIGSTVDTRTGTVGLTSAADLKGRTQRAQFHAGVFEVRQKRESKPTTELRLASASFVSYANACGAKVSRRTGVAAKSKKRVGRLFGSGKGRFKTRGRFSAATVRGTIWLTEDRCNGTLTQVTKGKVSVFDFGRDKRVFVTAGHSYLARATRAAIRKLGTK